MTMENGHVELDMRGEMGGRRGREQRNGAGVAIWMCVCVWKGRKNNWLKSLNRTTDVRFRFYKILKFSKLLCRHSKAHIVKSRWVESETMKICVILGLCEFLGPQYPGGGTFILIHGRERFLFLSASNFISITLPTFLLSYLCVCVCVGMCINCSLS